jgi:hypothetical protein
MARAAAHAVHDRRGLQLDRELIMVVRALRTLSFGVAAVLAVSLVALACAKGDAEGAGGSASDIVSQPGTKTKEVRLQSSNGAQITVTYHSLNPEGDTQAKAAVTVDLHTPLGSNCDAHVGVVVVTHCGQAPTFDTSNRFDLVRQSSDSGGGCFFRNPEPATVLYQTHAGICAQEIAVDTDGTFLVDPVNGTHNFQFTLEPTGF